MKKKLKNELEAGTFVNDSAYKALAEYTDIFLTLVCQETAIIFKESEDRKLTDEHVSLAILEVELNVSN
tara:strand:+ start:1490 stop:1696 length:207 start_codon:yes stop_codon:yes gene_type:complete